MYPIGPVAYAIAAAGLHALRTRAARLWRRRRTGAPAAAAAAA